MERVKTKIKCDQCDSEFESDYDPEWETPDDAAWAESCHDCGDVLCPKCDRYHDCSEWAAVAEDFNEK